MHQTGALLKQDVYLMTVLDAEQEKKSVSAQVYPDHAVPASITLYAIEIENMTCLREYVMRVRVCRYVRLDVCVYVRAKICMCVCGLVCGLGMQ